MPVTNRDLDIRATGTVDFVVDVVGGPADLNGYTGSMQIREFRNDILPLATVSPDAITVNPSSRQVHVQIPSTETAGYAWRRGVYDLKMTGPSGDAWVLVQGRITNALAITRED